MYALIFVVLVVFLFLGRWRATFIIALTIPDLFDRSLYLPVRNGRIAQRDFVVLPLHCNRYGGGRCDCST